MNLNTMPETRAQVKSTLSTIDVGTPALSVGAAILLAGKEFLSFISARLAYPSGNVS